MRKMNLTLNSSNVIELEIHLIDFVIESIELQFAYVLNAFNFSK